MSKKKVLITGGSGLLALNIAIYKKDDWEIFLVLNTKKVSIDRVVTVKLNLDSLGDVDEMVESIRPDYIIHTAGLTSVELCEKHRSNARISNVITTRNIAKVAGKYDIKLFHISTDHFTRSCMPNSSEEDIDIPLNYYAQTKLEAEFEVNRYSPDAVVLRTNFFGWGPSYRQSFSDFIIKSLRGTEKVHLFSDVFYNPILIDDLADIIGSLFESSFTGVLNAVGDDRVSKFEFGKMVASQFDLDESYLVPVLITDQKDMVKRPKDMSLSNNKLKEVLGEKSYSIESSLKKLFTQEFDGRDKQVNNAVVHEDPALIYYGKQSIDDDDFDAIMAGLNRSFLTQGPKIKEFEDKIAKYVGAKFAVAVSNLTAGLHIACLAAGLKKGDSLITSPISFVASSNCALYCGAKPNFADIDPRTLNIDAEEVRKRCKELGNVKVIIPVHFSGSPCDMKELAAVADEYGAVIIEDAAHALGAKYKTGEMVGSCEHSLMTGFSFHPVKSITMGEGGVITTNEEEIYKQLYRLRSHGIIKGNDPLFIDEEATTDGLPNPWYYEMQELGFNYRITDLQCCLGISQLKKLDRFIARRVEIAQTYDLAFKHLKNVKVAQKGTRALSAHHLYNIRVDFKKLGISKNELFELFKKEGISLHVFYIPIPMQPYYRDKLKTDISDYPNALKYYREAVTLPLYPDMTDKDINNVINAVKTIIK